jgi:hypothetical protein
MNEEKQRHLGSLFGSFLLIAAGIVLLLNNFEVLPWSIWDTIVIFWPVIFIMIGLDAIFSNTAFGGLLASIIGLFFIILILIISVSQVNPKAKLYFEKRLPFMKDLEAIVNKKNRLNPTYEFKNLYREFDLNEEVLNQGFDSQEESVRI